MNMLDSVCTRFRKAQFHVTCVNPLDSLLMIVMFLTISGSKLKSCDLAVPKCFHIATEEDKKGK